ncbi:MAG: hypothetical protein ACOCUI_00050 [bacterium]
MKSINIELNKEKYILKLSNRAAIKWENLNQRSFGKLTNSLADLFSLMYACLAANNENFTYTYNDFLDLMDDNISELNKFTNYFNEMTDISKEDKKKLKKRTEMLINLKS